MNDRELKALATSSRVLLSDEFFAGNAHPDFQDHVLDAGLDRTIDLAALDATIDNAMSSADYANNPAMSDSWLSPRIHAALRLRRSEAADRRLWNWLAVVKYSGYVRWRFRQADGMTTGKRFIGGDRDNAISRLWWGAELTRDGSDYSATPRAFDRQDIPSTWFSLDAFHNRAAALAAMKILPTLGSKPINALSTAFNHYLTTIMLDSIAPMDNPDLVALEEWIAAGPDIEELLLDQLPTGPAEDPVAPGSIAAVEALVRRVATEIGLTL